MTNLLVSSQLSPAAADNPAEMSISENPAPPGGGEARQRAAITERLGKCSMLPSLSSVNSVLRELLNAEQRYTTQISDVIRRDPSMTTRMLRLVNSVYYGLTNPVTSIEEAVFYLGIRQVRQIAMSTPIIEDLQKLPLRHPFPWREFWQHCIATAILTREITGAIQPMQDEVEYVAGLLHDVGRIVMAAEFPEAFAEVCLRSETSEEDLRAIEVAVLGMDHCELGGIYLKQHRLPDVIVETAEFHAEPERASHHGQLVAAVQLANHMVRLNKIGNSGNPAPITEESWLQLSGWGILFPRRTEDEQALLRATLKHSLDRLPRIIDGII